MYYFHHHIQLHSLEQKSLTACNENIKRHPKVTAKNECGYLYSQCKLLMPSSGSCVLKQENHEPSWFSMQ